MKSGVQEVQVNNIHTQAHSETQSRVHTNTEVEMEATEIDSWYRR